MSWWCIALMEELVNQIIMGVNIVAVEEAMTLATKADGCEKEDHSALVKFYEKISDTVVEY